MSHEEAGGDPACWSHLFDDEGDRGEAVDLLELARAAPGRGAVWSMVSADLNVNLVRFGPGEGVDEHINAELDVLLIGVAGSGVVTINGAGHELPAGNALLIEKGANRSTRAGETSFAYLTCHKRREGLWPSS